VPEPKISLSEPSLEAATIWGTVAGCRQPLSQGGKRGWCSLVRFLSVTLNLAGRPSRVFLPSAWERARERIESRVTPGRITVGVGRSETERKERDRGKMLTVLEWGSDELDGCSRKGEDQQAPEETGKVRDKQLTAILIFKHDEQVHRSNLC
jgi:hypothetical protein